MSIRLVSSILGCVLLVACASTRQIAIDYPNSGNAPSSSAAATTHRQFLALPGFNAIDGDEYYVRLQSEFNYQGENVLKQGCSNLAPSYEKNDMSSALVFTVRNEALKFTNEAVGFLYQASTGKCNFKFDAKKLTLTPWMRLDTGKDTQVDYSFYSSANSDMDVSGLVGDISAASSLLALTGVGMGVAIVGEVAGQWAKTSPAIKSAASTTAKSSTETHSLSSIVSFSGNTGSLNQTVFKVYAVAEGGVNILGSDTQPIGELKIFSEIIPSLLLKAKPDGIPDARDLSFDEISEVPIKSSTGEILLAQLIAQSKHSAKPNLKPNLANYEDVATNCRKIKLVMKDLGFNKFDRNAFLYYFLSNSPDWQNYHTPMQKIAADNLSAATVAAYQGKDFSACITADDLAVMRMMGLAVNLPADWQQITVSNQKKEQFYTPLKSVARQLLAVLKNPKQPEMEQQLFPLLATAKQGEGTVLLQNHLGDFGLEKLLLPPAQPDQPQANVAVVQPAAVPVVAAPQSIPGEGLIVTAKQLVQVFSGLGFDGFSCARSSPEQQGQITASVGIILFTTHQGGAWAKGGALEFEFSAGKINRLSFQLPTFRDFEQDVLDHPEVGGCRIEPSFLEKLH